MSSVWRNLQKAKKLAKGGGVNRDDLDRLEGNIEALDERYWASTAQAPLSRFGEGDFPETERAVLDEPPLSVDIPAHGHDVNVIHHVEDVEHTPLQPKVDPKIEVATTPALAEKPAVVASTMAIDDSPAEAVVNKTPKPEAKSLFEELVSGAVGYELPKGCDPKKLAIQGFDAYLGVPEILPDRYVAVAWQSPELAIEALEAVNTYLRNLRDETKHRPLEEHEKSSVGVATLVIRNLGAMQKHSVDMYLRRNRELGGNLKALTRKCSEGSVEAVMSASDIELMAKTEEQGLLR